MKQIRLIKVSFQFDPRTPIEKEGTFLVHLNTDEEMTSLKASMDAFSFLNEAIDAEGVDKYPIKNKESDEVLHIDSLDDVDGTLIHSDSEWSCYRLN